MFSQNSISKDLQDSILKVMEGNIKHPNQQKIDVHEPEKDEITADDFKKLRKMKKEDTDSQIQELAGKKDGKMPKPMKEATKIIVHDDEAEDKTLIKKMINKEKKVDEATAQKMGHAGKVTMKHVNASGATPQVKAAIKKAAPDIKTYGDRAAALDSAGIKREEVEFEESVESNDTHFAKQSKKMQDAINLHLRKGKSYKEAVAASKVHVKEEVEQFDETVLVHATYEIKESYTFGEYLTAAKYLVGDDEAVELANEAFKVQDTDIFAEELSSMDIMSRINSHRKAGHAVTEPKYSTKAGKPYHEYVVTDKETGTRRKYIHHGDVSKVENMGAKPKKDEQ